MKSIKVIRSVEDVMYWNDTQNRYVSELNDCTHFGIIVDSISLSRAARIAPCEIVSVYVTEGMEETF